MHRSRTISRCFGALALAGFLLTTVLISPGISAGAADPASATTAAQAVAWLHTQQQADGGFEVAGFPGFETPDAVLAIAESVQAGGAWSTTTARAGVVAVTTGGRSGLDALDTFASTAFDAGKAAKLIVLDAAPLGLDASAFDPAGDGTPVNLLAIVDAGAGADGSYGAFNATLYAALAKHLTSGSVPASTLTLIRGAQQANGGWGYAGDPAGTDVDPDTTGLAIQVLVAGGATSTDPSVAKALKLLADNQNADGSWASPFDSGNPNSTAVAIQAIAAVGYDPTVVCWRDAADAAKQGSAYSSPDATLRAAQTPAGNIASPNDQFGLNTFPTAQAVQALLREWLPVVRAEAPACVTPTTITSTTTTSTTAPTQVAGATTHASTAKKAGTLPNTGSSSGPLALVGGVLLAGGVALLMMRRRGRA